jgi:hypothetical protein
MRRLGSWPVESERLLPAPHLRRRAEDEDAMAEIIHPKRHICLRGRRELVALKPRSDMMTRNGVIATTLRTFEEN